MPSPNVNIGDQHVSFSYKFPIEAAEFNKLWRGILRHGTYNGLLIERKSDTVATMTPGACMVDDGTYLTKILFNEAVDIQANRLTPYVVIRYEYRLDQLWYATVLTLASPDVRRGTPDPTTGRETFRDVVVGRLRFDGDSLKQYPESWIDYDDSDNGGAIPRTVGNEILPNLIYVEEPGTPGTFYFREHFPDSNGYYDPTQWANGQGFASLEALNLLLHGTLQVDGDTRFQKKLAVGTDLDVGGNAHVAGSTTIDGNLSALDAAFRMLTLRGDINLTPTSKVWVLDPTTGQRVEELKLLTVLQYQALAGSNANPTLVDLPNALEIDGTTTPTRTGNVVASVLDVANLKMLIYNQVYRPLRTKIDDHIANKVTDTNPVHGILSGHHDDSTGFNADMLDGVHWNANGGASSAVEDFGVDRSAVGGTASKGIFSGKKSLYHWLISWFGELKFYTDDHIKTHDALGLATTQLQHDQGTGAHFQAFADHNNKVMGRVPGDTIGAHYSAFFAHNTTQILLNGKGLPPGASDMDYAHTLAFTMHNNDLPIGGTNPAHPWQAHPGATSVGAHEGLLAPLRDGITTAWDWADSAHTAASAAAASVTTGVGAHNAATVAAGTHANLQGHTKGFDADKLDGYHAGAMMAADGITPVADIKTYIDNKATAAAAQGAAGGATASNPPDAQGNKHADIADSIWRYIRDGQGNVIGGSSYDFQGIVDEAVAQAGSGGGGGGSSTIQPYGGNPTWAANANHAATADGADGLDNLDGGTGGYSADAVRYYAPVRIRATPVHGGGQNGNPGIASSPVPHATAISSIDTTPDLHITYYEIDNVDYTAFILPYGLMLVGATLAYYDPSATWGAGTFVDSIDGGGDYNSLPGFTAVAFPDTNNGGGGDGGYIIMDSPVTARGRLMIIWTPGPSGNPLPFSQAALRSGGFRPGQFF